MNELFTNIGNFLSNIDVYLEIFLSSLGIWGIVLSCGLITIESIIPVLPLCVFVTLIFYKFGMLVGLLICWVFTCLGCSLSFLLCRKGLKGWVDRVLSKKEDRSLAKKLMHYIDNMSLSSLAVLVSIPFTPAFAVNIAAGMSNMKYEKFILAMAIGKIFMVFFWGFIGVKLIDCIKSPINLLWISFMLLGAFVISKIFNRYLKLD